MAETPDSKPHEIDLVEFITSLGRQTHAATVMVLSARLEQALTWIIQGRMPNLSNRQKPKLFEAYGPLASFSAKIDVGFALGFITESERRTLHTIRQIRNEFAHSDDPKLSFDHDAMQDLLLKLPIPTALFTSNLHRFTAVASECAGDLQKHLDQIELARAVGEYGKTPSPEKTV
jgi:hypothetical protein